MKMVMIITTNQNTGLANVNGFKNIWNDHFITLFFFSKSLKNATWYHIHWDWTMGRTVQNRWEFQMNETSGNKWKRNKKRHKNIHEMKKLLNKNIAGTRTRTGKVKTETEESHSYLFGSHIRSAPFVFFHIPINLAFVLFLVHFLSQQHSGCSVRF